MSGPQPPPPPHRARRDAAHAATSSPRTRSPALAFVLFAAARRCCAAPRPLDRAVRSAGERHRQRAAAPSRRALVRHRPARPRHLLPRHRRDAARPRHRGASVALASPLAELPGIAAGFFGGWTDRIVGRIVDTIMAFPLFVLAMGIVAALGNSVPTSSWRPRSSTCRLRPRRPRRGHVRRNAGFVEAARLSGNCEVASCSTLLPDILPIMMVQVSLTMGYAILNAAGLSFIGLGVRPPTAEWGIMVAEGASSSSPANGGSPCSPVGADARGVLLQPAGRRPARHRRPPEAHIEPYLSLLA